MTSSESLERLQIDFYMEADLLWLCVLSLPQNRILREFEVKIAGQDLSFSDILAKDLTKISSSVQIETTADFDLCFEFPSDFKNSPISTENSNY